MNDFDLLVACLVVLQSEPIHVSQADRLALENRARNEIRAKLEAFYDIETLDKETLTAMIEDHLRRSKLKVA